MYLHVYEMYLLSKKQKIFIGKKKKDTTDLNVADVDNNYEKRGISLDSRNSYRPV